MRGGIVRTNVYQDERIRVFSECTSTVKQIDPFFQATQTCTTVVLSIVMTCHLSKTLILWITSHGHARNYRSASTD